MAIGVRTFEFILVDGDLVKLSGGEKWEDKDQIELTEGEKAAYKFGLIIGRQNTIQAIAERFKAVLFQEIHLAQKGD